MRLSSRLMVRKWLRIKMRCNGFLHFHFTFSHFVIEQWVEKDNQIDPVVDVFFRDCFHCSCGWRKLVISKRISEEKKLKKNSRPMPMGYHRRDNMLGHFWTQSLHLWKRTWLTERISLQKLQLKTQDKAAGLKVVANSSAAQEICWDGYQSRWF